jgi:hypothetical protein
MNHREAITTIIMALRRIAAHDDPTDPFCALCHLPYGCKDRHTSDECPILVATEALEVWADFKADRKAKKEAIARDLEEERQGQPSKFLAMVESVGELPVSVLAVGDPYDVGLTVPDVSPELAERAGAEFMARLQSTEFARVTHIQPSVAAKFADGPEVSGGLDVQPDDVPLENE